MSLSDGAPPGAGDDLSLAARVLRQSAVAILALGLVGCGVQSGGSTAPVRAAGGSGLDVSVGLDRQTGAIVFPHERFLPTFQEQDLLTAAISYSLSECLNSRGIAFAPSSGAWDPLYDASEYFGVWTTSMAERFAFVSPMTQADMRANGVTINGEQVPESAEPPAAWKSNDLSSDEALAAVDECNQLPEVARFDLLKMAPGPWTSELTGTFDLASQTKDWKETIAEYHRCLVGKGIEPEPDDDLAVVGEDGSTISAEQIELALDVVDCKDQVRLVERLAGQIAAYQAPIIDEYATELVAYRSRVDSVLKEAREYLAGQGVTE